MKHLKLFERRNFKDYVKYKDILINKFSIFIKVHDIVIYEENNIINIDVKTWRSIDEKFFKFMQSEMGDIKYSIIPGSLLLIKIYHIPKTFLQQLELEMSAKKYNL